MILTYSPRDRRLVNAWGDDHTTTVAAGEPILVLGITSDNLPLTTVDAYAENILLQKISQIPGVGLVGVGGQQKAAVRIQVDPQALAARGINLEDVRTVLGQANVDLAKGTLNSPTNTYTLNTNDQLLQPEPYNSLIVAYQNGSPVRVSDIGRAIDGPENNLLAGWMNQHSPVCPSAYNSSTWPARRAYAPRPYSGVSTKTNTCSKPPAAGARF